MKFREITSQVPNAVNLAGSQAYSQTSEVELVSLLLTTFLKDTHYEKASDKLQRLQILSRNLPVEFVAQCAIYARTQHGIRSATHVIAGELINRLKGNLNGAQIIANIIYRADDMLELFSYYRMVYGKKTPAVLRKGIQKALGKFDEYQIAKYKAPNSSFKMVDLFNLVHPKPNEKQSSYYAKLMKNELANTETWEAKLSAAGSDADLKHESWRELLTNKKLGYFALLRNLRNILQDAPDLINMACEQLKNEKSI